MSSRISKPLLKWYDRHARILPWRVGPKDHLMGLRAAPYHVWLSEIMLQQTQVTTVKAYFEKFLNNWPSVVHLAAASQDDVMKVWAGLGYYSRARNLKKCADIVCLDHAGLFPEDKAGLIQLPGIGDYTSAAIAAIAFDKPEPVVDGNVERVVSRLFRVKTPLPAAKVLIRDTVKELLSTSRPGCFAQACMDLGATICTPKNPVCALCPLNQICDANQHGDQLSYPIKAPKKTKPTRVGAAYVLQNRKGGIYLIKRSENGLLGGMTGVPTTNWTANQDGQTGISSAPSLANWQQSGTISHTFTHFHLKLEVWSALGDTNPDQPGWWCDATDLHKEALPTVFKKVLEVALPNSTHKYP